MTETPPSVAAKIPGRSRLLLSGLAITWVFGVVTAYYAVHKPFDLAQLRALGQVGLDVALWVALLAAATALGQSMLGSFAELLPAERFVFGAGVGLAALGYAVMGLGLAGLLRPALLGLLLVAGLAWLVRRPRRWTAGWRDGFRWPRPAGRFEWACAGFALFALALTFVWALTPPYAFDAAVYHLRQTKLYLEQQTLFVPVDSAYAGFPGLMQMLFALPMALGGDSAPQLIHFTFLPLTIGAAGALGRRLWHAELTWPVAAMLTAIPSLLLLAAWPYVDAALMFYTLLIFYALSVWLAGGSDRYLWLAAGLCGVAIEIKYTALWQPLACAGLVLLRLRRDGWRITLLHLAGFGLVAGLVGAPWYLRNWLLAGNPIYPYLWGGAGWDAGRAAWWDRPGTGLASEPWRLLAALWDMTVLGTEGKEGYSATLGPLMLAVAPLLALVWPRLERSERRSFRSLAWIGVFTGVLYAVWLWGVARSNLLMQSRLLLPVFPLVALMAALALRRLPALNLPALSVSWLVKAALSLVLALEALSLGTAFVRDRPLAPLLGLETRADYAARRMGTAYAAAIQQVNDLPPGSVTLFLWEPRTYHCRQACIPDSLYDNLVHLASRHSQAQGVVDELRAQRVTHVLLNHQIMELAVAASNDPIRPADLAVLSELQARVLHPVYADGVMYTLYALEPPR